MNGGHPHVDYRPIIHPFLGREKKSGDDLFFREVAFILFHVTWISRCVLWTICNRGLHGIKAIQDPKTHQGQEAMIPLNKIARVGALNTGR